MPQLATETYVSQIFWFLLVLVLLHVYMTNTVIPQISTLLKARKKLNMGGVDSDGEGNVLSAQALLVNNAMTEVNTVLDSKKLTISHDNLSKELQS